MQARLLSLSLLNQNTTQARAAAGPQAWRCCISTSVLHFYTYKKKLAREQHGAAEFGDEIDHLPYSRTFHLRLYKHVT